MTFKPADEETAREFVKSINQRRMANRTAVLNYKLVCARCNWSIANDQAKAQGLTCCQRCGARECRVVSLDYNLALPTNEIPENFREAKAWAMRDLPGRAQ